MANLIPTMGYYACDVTRIKNLASAGFLLSMENPQLGWGFRKAFSFKPVIKTPFDLLKHLAVWQLQKFNKKSKGGPNGGRKELSAHPMEL
ncbi:hypothetical protein E5O02_05360 [Salmonella enterica subsp. enterica serovar 1,4,[5],12:i:-]|nr:hypothetical protein E5O02_05360 [Salmonella enterica subsp. enterica serovar 1,4,[5],12:i:-]